MINQDGLLNKQTYVFKQTPSCELKADVYGFDENKTRPVVIWIHGGALMGGNRDNIPDYQIRLYVEAGYTLVSFDYRLAPAAKISSIISDLSDGFSWVYNDGPKLFNIDPQRIAVIGHSAGGYLALMSGVIAKDKVKAIVSFYGYGDIIGAWYSKPDPYYCSQGLVPKENAHERFYLYCRQNGLWPKEVTGYDPFEEPEKIYPYCPIRNITEDYPPTLLIHGDIDTDVPCAQSILMAYEMLKIKARHELHLLSGFGHAFDMPENAMEKPEIAEAFKHVLWFLKTNVK